MSVSVVMPNYNNARFLRETLASVIDDPAVREIIIYDNGSTDESLEIARTFSQSKIRIIEGSKNLGATLGRHQAVLAATSDNICYLDGDDTLSPGAINTAYATLVANQLDISLFDLVNVDVDGANPTPFILPSREVIDGKTACAMTLGGWRMHIWGVITKPLYLRAWNEFRAHGYSDDELLTRAILLRARRVGAGGGTIFYRVVPKERKQHHVLGVNRTAIRTLALGVDSGLDPEAIRLQQEMVVRFLTGLVRRGLSGSLPWAEVAKLVDEYRVISISAPSSLRGFARDRLVRVARRLLS